jgi:hypothetical protein
MGKDSRANGTKAGTALPVKRITCTARPTLLKLKVKAGTTYRNEMFIYQTNIHP